MFDLKRLGQVPGLDWRKPLADYSVEEMLLLGEAFLSCVSPKTVEEINALKEAYQENIDKVPF